MIKKIYMLTLCCGVIAFVATKSEAQRRNTVQSEWLVQAEVININNNAQTGQISEQKITHVYVGSQDLIGQKFTMSAPTGIDSVGLYSFPSHKGLKGIWLLRKYKESFLPVTWAYNILFPVIEDVSPRYLQVLQLAEAFESVSAMTEDKRPELLQSLALSPVPEISFAAIKKLLKVKQEDTNKKSQELLANPKLTISGQIAIDEILSQYSDTNWQSSPQRLKLLQTWVSSNDLSEYEAGQIISRLSYALQSGELKIPIFFGLLKALLKNDKFPQGLKQQAIRIITHIPTDTKDIETVTTFLIGQIKATDDISIKTVSSRTLLNLIDANKINLAHSDLADIRLLQKKTQDTMLKSILDGIIKASKR